MSYGITSNEVASYYNGMLPYFKLYDEVMPARLNTAIESLKKVIKPGDTVLDIGCSTGITSRAMGKAGAVVTGVDIAPDLIAYAEEKNFHYNIDYLVGDVVELSLGKKFDIISMVDVIEHIPPLYFGRAIFNIAGHCKPSTLLYINTPDTAFADYVFEAKPESKQIIDNPYYPHELCEILLRYGFALVHFNAYGPSGGNPEYNEYWFMRKERSNRAVISI